MDLFHCNLASDNHGSTMPRATYCIVASFSNGTGLAMNANISRIRKFQRERGKLIISVT